MSETVKCVDRTDEIIKEVKECGQELINKAEDYIGTGDMLTDFTINIHINVTGEEAPSITVTREHYPRTTFDRYRGGVK